MTFTSPSALLLLLIALPIVCYIGWPRSRWRRGRDSVSLFLRVSIVTLLVMGLAGTSVIRSADRLAVVYLLDMSDSMGTTLQDAARDFIAQSINELRPGDVAGVVAFAETAQIARNMSDSRELGAILAAPPAGNTDYAAAIRLALAILPQDADRRIVLLSDGRPTRGDWESAADLAASAGVEISYVSYTRPPTPEVLVRAVDVPAVLNEDQAFTLSATLYSETDTTADITVLAGGAIVRQERIALAAGETVYPVRLQSGSAGFRDFEVRIDPQGEDGFFQNNQLAAFSRVTGEPRVLLVDGSDDFAETAQIAPALTGVGLNVETITPDQLPPSFDGLAGYQSVILANISATDMPPRQLRALEVYVRDLGGGLVVIGGPQSYAPGGYFQTPLEDALPVEMRIDDEERLPTLTIAYVIDRSGSMNLRTPSGITWLDVAKEAIIRSLDFLTEADRAGVASFDTSAFWVFDFQNVTDRTALQRQVASLRAGGGTSIRAGMEFAAETIVDEPSNLKHIILLTDGGAPREGLPEFTEALYRDENVTTTVISIGDWESGFMEEMAELGGGNFYQVIDAEQIPLIFAAETVLTTRTYIQEEDFTPRQRPHPVMDGIGGLPPLRGYVTTTARPAATVILRAPEPYADPIMAAWQYGLGRSVAFTSDATGRWGADWINWDDFATFWGQTVRWTISDDASRNLETQVTRRDGSALITVDARDDDGNFLNGLALSASVVHAREGDARRIGLQQVAPGRYEGRFVPMAEGAHLVRVGTPDAAYTQTIGWVRGYSREYDMRPPATDILAEIARRTGGADLSDDPAAVWTDTATATRGFEPIWPFLLLLAVVLLPFDVGVRRLLITRTDLERLRAWLITRRTGDETPADQRMATLQQARQRARSATRQPAIDRTALSAPARTAAPEQADTDSTAGQADDDPTARQSDADPTARESDFGPTAGQPDVGNIGSRLLRKRRGDGKSSGG
ncbi:MAG: VWA domain-containing protein [Anaerolineaceae bacterium]|nr:MAG: VWA domain-containing protein [Anaerolineaceae bacterium]